MPPTGASHATPRSPSEVGVRDLPREVDVVEIGSTIPGMRIEGFEEEFPPSVNPIWGIGLGGGIAPIGDFDGDGLLILEFLFLGGDAPRCEDAADTDDTGSIAITDAVSLLQHLFHGGSSPPPPYPEKGKDPTGDDLECRG